jgi:O-antigen ligase
MAYDPVKQAGLMDQLVLWVLSLFAFLLPTDLRLAGDKSIAMRVGYACLLLGIAGIMRRRTAIVPTLGFWSLLGFVFWSTCTLGWAQYPSAAEHKVVAYWLLLAVSAIIPQYAWSARGRALLMDAYIWGCWLGVIGTAVNFWTGTEYSEAGPGELAGRYSFSTDPNYLALALVIGIPLAIYRGARTDNPWRRLPLLLYTPAAIAGVVLTGSRGAVIALLTALLACAFQISWKMRGLLAGTAAIFLLAMWLGPSQISQRLSTIPDELRHGSLSDRRDLWDRGQAVAREHPIEGIGAGATTGKLEIAAHNTPLELMMEGGAVSVVLFYGAMLFGLTRLWKTDSREGAAMTALCAAWAVGSLSLSWEVNTITWFILTMLFSAGSPRCISASSFSPEMQTAGHA